MVAAVSPPGGTLYALPSASEELVDDAIVNMEGFIEENVVDAMAEKESEAFINGDGNRKPAGILSPTGPQPSLLTDGNRQLGSIPYIPTDAASGAGIGTVEQMLRMVFALKASYRQAPGTAWLASTDFIANYLTRMTDPEGHYVYIASAQDGVPGRLLGYPVIECEHMATVATAALLSELADELERTALDGDAAAKAATIARGWRAGAEQLRAVEAAPKRRGLSVIEGGA